MLVDPTSEGRTAISIYAEQPGTAGVASLYEISAFRSMSISDFKEHIVPNLKDTEASGRFFYYVIRDLSEGRIFSLYPDGVMEYKVNSLREVKTEQLVTALLEQTGEKESLSDTILNSQFPVWAFAENTGYWRMSVKVPETRFQFRHPNLFRNEADYPWIFMPPVIYTVLARKSDNTVKDTYIKLLVQDSLAEEKCSFAHLPLPNIWSDGRICVGDTYLKDSNDMSQWSKTKVVAASLDLFLNTNWNYDLFDSYIPDNLNAVYMEMYPELEIPDRLRGGKGEQLWKIVHIYKEQGAWEKLHYHPM